MSVEKGQRSEIKPTQQPLRQNIPTQVVRFRATAGCNRRTSLILPRFQGFSSCSFVNDYEQQETEGAHLLDELSSPDHFSHSHQITQSERLLILAPLRNEKLYLLTSWSGEQLPQNLQFELLLCVSFKMFYLAYTSTGRLCDKLYQDLVQNVNRL